MRYSVSSKAAGNEAVGALRRTRRRRGRTPMTSPVLSTPFDDEARAIIARALVSGEVMAYPTETSYALGGNGLDECVCRAVRRIKGRAGDKALSLLIDGAPMLGRLTRDVTPAAQVLMERYWPGPLTLVFHAAPGLPPQTMDARDTVALRWSPHPVVGALLAIGCVPLIGTSANRAGGQPLHSAEEVVAAFGETVAVVLDDDEPWRAEAEAEAEWGRGPSTLVDTTVEPFHVIRPGAVAKSMIQATLAERFIRAVPD